jgi:lysophospholipase L1-like esterase
MPNRNNARVIRSSTVFAFLLACACAIGCATNHNTASAPKAPPTTQRVACVGDSITYGAGITDRDHQSYPAQLQQVLGDHYEVRNFGNSGATLLKKGNKPYVQQKEYPQALAFKPDVVVIKLGTNDSKPENWDAHKGEFVPDYKDLIASFRQANPDAKVYVCLPVPAFPGRWGISEQTISREVIPAVRKVAGETNAKVIDLHSALANQAQYFPDTVHPNERGAAEIARAVGHALNGR